MKPSDVEERTRALSNNSPLAALAEMPETRAGVYLATEAAAWDLLRPGWSALYWAQYQAAAQDDVDGAP